MNNEPNFNRKDVEPTGKSQWTGPQDIEDICLTMNTRPNTEPRRSKGHWAIKIESQEVAQSIKDYCADHGHAVWDATERGIYPKFLVIPNRPPIVGILDGDLIRVYEKTHFPLRTNTADTNFPWKMESVSKSLLSINQQLKNPTPTVPTGKHFVITESKMLDLLNDMGQFLDTNKFLNCFDRKSI